MTNDFDFSNTQESTSQTKPAPSFNAQEQPKKAPFKTALIIIASLFILALLTFVTYFAFNKYIKEQKTQKGNMNSYALIDKDLADEEISNDEAVKNKFYAVLDKNKLNPKYKSDESIDFPDLDELLVENEKNLKEETLKELASYLLPSRALTEMSSPNEVLASDRRVNFDGKIEGKNVIVYYQKNGSQKVSEEKAKETVASTDRAFAEYSSWGLKKPTAVVVYETGLTKDDSKKIPVYLLNYPPRGYDNAGAYAVDNPGVLKILEPFFNARPEFRENIVFPYINVFANDISKKSSKYGASYSDVLNFMIHHETFHTFQYANGFESGIKETKWWAEATAQWASLQLNPNNPIFYKRWLPPLFENPDRSLTDRTDYFDYSIFPFVEIFEKYAGKAGIKAVFSSKNPIGTLTNQNFAGKEFPQIFHEFAVKNYQLNYGKKGIDGIGRRPKSQSVEKINQLSLKPYSTAYLSVDKPGKFTLNSTTLEGVYYSTLYKVGENYILGETKKITNGLTIDVAPSSIAVITNGTGNNISFLSSFENQIKTENSSNNSTSGTTTIANCQGTSFAVPIGDNNLGLEDLLKAKECCLKGSNGASFCSMFDEAIERCKSGNSNYTKCKRD